MRNEDFADSGVMEKQIIAEEGSPEDQITPQKIAKKRTGRIPKIDLRQLQSKLQILKNRKLQIGIAIFLLIIVIFSAFLMLSRKTAKMPARTVVKITIASPAPTPDSELEQVKKDVTVYNNELDSLDSELENIKFPSIDLDIKF